MKRAWVAKTVLWVVAVHLIVLLGLSIMPWLRNRLREPQPLIIPIELAVAVSRPASEYAPVTAVEPDFEQPEPAPEPEIEQIAFTNQAPPKVEIEPEPPRKRRRIEVSQERVVRQREAQPEPVERQSALSPDDLRGILQDALAVDATITEALPGADERDLELIRRTLYQAWRQPAGHHLRGVVTVASLRLDSRGNILQSDIERTSGDKVVDASVRDALDAVERIPGLSPEFAARRPRVSIYFELAD